MAKPKPINIKPIANFTGPEGLYLLSHILENKGAKAIIKNEFKIPNQEAGTSVASALNSLISIQITIPQMIRKLVPRNILDREYFANVFLNRFPNTTDKIIMGTTVSRVFIILNVVALPPDKDLSV